jgi:hypothetical protein
LVVVRVGVLSYFMAMESFEFYDLYRQYSTVDLINIVREKEKYQAAAVLTAERVLGERDVSSVDQQEADEYFRERETKRMAATAKVDSYKATVADWVEPIARPSAELQPYKWYRIFLVVYGFWYARDLYYIIRYFIAASKFGLGPEDFVFVGVTLALDSLFFVLIFQKRKWGWILLVVEHTYLIFADLAVFVEMSRFKLFLVNAMPNLYGALFHLAMVGFLWRRPMAAFFGVGPVVKKRALGVGLGLGVVFAGFALYSILQNGSPVPLRGKPLSVPHRVQPIVPARP